MSIGPARTTDATAPPTRQATPQSFALRYAKRSFEPFNTDSCPQMFADKWAVDPE